MIDASVVLCWAFDDEQAPAAMAALSALEVANAYTSRMLWFEVRNALLMRERRGRIDASGATHFLSRLAELNINIDDAVIESDLMALARKHRLTVYDAAYLELAKRRSAALATLDGDLAKAAGAEGVDLVQ